MASADEVLKVVKARGYRQMTTEELAERLSVPDEETPELFATLEGLQRDGHLVRVKDKHWVNPSRSGLMVGRLKCNERGFGFVIPVLGDGDDVYVAEEGMSSAMDGDLVVVEVRKREPRHGVRRGRKDRGPAGRIIKVIDRANERIIGAFVPGKRFGRVVPDNPRLFKDVYVAREDWLGAEEGDQVLVEVNAWPSLHRNPEGAVREVIGKVGDPGVDVQSVILEFGLPREFPEEALRAAEALVAMPEQVAEQNRRDLRQYATITVDPEDAKDFDDALSFYRDPGTGRRIALVHIADASLYVPADGVLDAEARKRGNSVYLADRVVPMLPHEQSKNVLSLVAGEDRPAKTVKLEFDDKDNVVDYAVCHSLVHVDRRMTYTEVQAALEAAEADAPAERAAVEKLPETIWALLTELDELAGRLKRRRRDVGSVDLDVPDYDVSIGEDGRVIGVVRIERDRSHGLVEELMLAANRCVADFMRRHKLPALYRTHDEPPDEDVAEFGDFIETTLNRRIDARDRKALQELLDEVAGTHVAEAVNMQLLRTMQRALYGTRCTPHFALHFDRYLHFTSPVRRYADMVVHQVLDAFLLEGEGAARLRSRWREKLPAIATHCNQMQERADRAEREIVRIKLLRYLEDHLDEVFDGIVTGVQEYGIFVRLEDYYAEGLIKVKDLRGDFYRYDEKRRALVGTRTGREFHLGQPLQVTISAIDMARRRLDLALKE